MAHVHWSFTPGTLADRAMPTSPFAPSRRLRREDNAVKRATPSLPRENGSGTDGSRPKSVIAIETER
jgi:hypothetical protein